jgi:fatty acid desaturase
MRRDVRQSPATTILRAKVVLTAIALAAAVGLIAVASWPLKVLVVLAFVRGLFASDLIALRNAPRWRSSEQASPTAS